MSTVDFSETPVDEPRPMDSRPLLEILQDALPIKRQVNIEGWPRPAWIWRLELPQLLELNRKHALFADGERGRAEWGIELLVMCLGDEGAPGAFQSAAGRSWLRRQCEAVMLLIDVAVEFNELNGASPERKKKSETPGINPSSPSASESA